MESVQSGGAAVPEQSPELSFGQKLIGVTFNPSGDPRVNRLKELAAEMADIVTADYHSKHNTPIGDILFTSTMGEIVNGQMNAVKFVTNRY